MVERTIHPGFASRKAFTSWSVICAGIACYLPGPDVPGAPDRKGRVCTKLCIWRVQVVIMAASIAVACHEAPAVPTHSDNDRGSRLPSQGFALSFACHRNRGGRHDCWAAPIQMALVDSKCAHAVELEKYVCISSTLLRGHSQLSPAKSHVMQERPTVVISATTADLGSYRLAVRDT